MLDFRTRDYLNQLVWATRGNAAAQEAIDGLVTAIGEIASRDLDDLAPDMKEGVAVARS